MAKFSKLKLNRDKIKGNIKKARNFVDSYFEIKIENEEKLVDNSITPYVSIDFKFSFNREFGSVTVSNIYNYIAEYANKHTLRIISISDINKDSSDFGLVSVIFEKL